jgi:hypothetical protein
MFCPKCGANILLEDSNFCIDCGFDLRQISKSVEVDTHDAPGASKEESPQKQKAASSTARVPTPSAMIPKKSKLRVFSLVSAISVSFLVLALVLVSIISPSLFERAVETVQGSKTSAGTSKEEAAKESANQMFANALAYANQSKIKESLTLLRAITDPSLRQQVEEMKLNIGKAIIQGSWEQSEGGMGYTRIIRFDDGIIAVVDNFTNSSYRGSYEVRTVSDAGDLATLDIYCTLRYGYQDATIRLSVEFRQLRSIRINGNWAPTSNGTYTKLN